MELSKKVSLFLILLLTLNTLRYATYLIEEEANVYNVLLFIVNFCSIFVVLFYKNSEYKA